MKSPNVKSTSDRRATTGVRAIKYMRSFAPLLAACSVLLCSCQSSNHIKTNAPSNNPYAQYEPKTPEEEAYYRDVYSGDWREQTDPAGMGKSICKKSGSTTMPPHWAAMPPGAKTLEEIRSEASYKRTTASLARPIEASAPPLSYSSAPTQTNYAAQAYAVPQSHEIQPQNVVASQPAGPNTVYPSQAAASAQLVYPEQIGARSVVNATQPIYDPQTAQTQQVYAAPAQQQAYVGQAVLQAQPNSVPAAYAPQAAPTQNASPTQMSVPSQYTPSTYQGASVIRESFDALGEKATIVRGQEPAEETVEEKAESDKNVDVKEENVKVRASEKAVVALDESRTNSVAVKPNIVDPSLAAPYANVNRPEANPSAPANESSSRDVHDEYVVSGGDSKGKVVAHEDWLVENLDPEDTAAHFDTTDGRILTEPTNRVFLYSPRFGAVRQIVAPVEGNLRTVVGAATTSEGAVEDAKAIAADVRSQDVKLLTASGSQEVAGAESAMTTNTTVGRVGVIEADGQLRLNQMLTSATVDSLGADESALLMDGAIAAQGWSEKQGIAVAADQTGVHSNVYLDGPATVYAIQDGTVTSKLRVIKIANKDSARPGEFVEFTLRFENIGDKPIGNVTILDNLSARLRYVDGTAKSSVKADFLADLSETGSLVLRWEITDPLQPKEFGVVRFICKVQ